MYQSQGIGSSFHVGSIFGKDFQAESCFHRGTKPYKAFPEPQTHILTTIWVSYHTWTKPLISVVQTLRGGKDLNATYFE